MRYYLIFMPLLNSLAKMLSWCFLYAHGKGVFAAMAAALASVCDGPYGF
jgi:hypothetical protein